MKVLTLKRDSAAERTARLDAIVASLPKPAHQEGEMNPSIYADELLHPRRIMLRKLWNVLCPWIIVGLLFLMHAMTTRWDREFFEQEEARLKRDRQQIDTERAQLKAMRDEVPEHVFVISARTPRELSEKLSRMEDASVRFRISGMTAPK